MSSYQVAEVQGLYGPFTLSERVVQKIWLRQAFFKENLITASGKQLIIKDPGSWNLNEGPDFKEAQLILDGVEVIGDVEVHINLLDWRYHKHERDPNYDRVLLHVVLYLRDTDAVDQVKTSQGHMPEMLHLIPLLNQDIESYAMDDALLKLERQNELEWVAQFTELPLEKRIQILKRKALERWQQKLSYAKQRLQAKDWEAACHSYMMEVLGYKRNRTSMLRLAERYPLSLMRNTLSGHQGSNVEDRIVEESGRTKQFGRIDHEVFAAQLFDEESDHWKLNGLRPANHPKRRLEQYLEIISRQPNWPSLLVDCLRQVSTDLPESKTAVFRKAVGLPRLRDTVRRYIFKSIIGEKRLNTLVVDAILPLFTVAEQFDGSEYWLHWFAGDSPEALQRFLKYTGAIDHRNPLSNGLIQGALGLFIDQGG